MEKYKLIDEYNGDIVYHGDSKDEMEKLLYSYVQGCEDDWLPDLYINDKYAPKWRYSLDSHLPTSHIEIF